MIYYQNVRGLRTKTVTLYNKSFTVDYDVIALTETWLSLHINDEELLNNSYTIFRRDRYSDPNILTVGGGVLIAVKKELIAESVDINLHDDLEIICVKVKNISSTYYMVNIYIHPNSPLSTYEKFNDIMEGLFNTTSASDKIICMGDFNVPTVSWNYDDETDQIIPSPTSSTGAINPVFDHLASLGLQQVNSVKNAYLRTLDLVFTSLNLDVRLDRQLDPLIKEDNYHPAIEIQASFDNYSYECVEDKFDFDFKKLDYIKLNNLLNQTDWSFIYNCNNCIDFVVANFYSVLYCYLLDSAPIRKTRKHCLSAPWYNGEIKSLKNQRNKAWYRYKITNSSLDYATYCHIRNRFNSVVNVAQEKYTSDLQNRIKSSPRYFWNFINKKRKNSSYPSSFSFNNYTTHSLPEISNLFAEFFESAFVTSIRNNNCDFSNLESYSYLNNISFDIDHLSVEKVLSNLDDCHTAGPDGIPPFLLKNCVKTLAAPLTYLFNLSLSRNHFPTLWKSSFIIPLHKSGTKHNINNYRGIARLSTIPKVFELMISEVISFNCRSLIVQNQHGFVKGKSTITNLLEFSHFCSNAIEDKSQVDLVITDFSKAFDKLSHSVLINKLNTIGFNTNFLSWLKSYLSDRNYQVLFNNNLSRSFVVNSGVPQGSHLGPILFIILINDLPSVLKFSNSLMYADDAKLFKRIKSIADCINFQSDLLAFSRWCTNNSLYLNFDKCLIMSITRKKIYLKHDYRFDTMSIKRVLQIKDLGVTYDIKFNFNDHFNKTVNRANSILGFIKRESIQIKDPHILKLLYISFVRPVIEYGSQIWSPYYKCHSDRIESIQKRFLRYCLKNLNWIDPVTLPPYRDRLRLIDLPLLTERREYLGLSFIVKILNGQINTDLLSSINLIAPSKGLRNHNLIRISHHYTSYSYYNPLENLYRLYNKFSKSLIDFEVDADKFKKLIYAL